MGQPQESLQGLLAFLRPDESAQELLARTHVERRHTNIPFVDSHVTLRPGQALEIAGPSGSGKTELLLQVCGLHCHSIGWG